MTFDTLQYWRARAERLEAELAQARNDALEEIAQWHEEQADDNECGDIEHFIEKATHEESADAIRAMKEQGK